MTPRELINSIRDFCKRWEDTFPSRPGELIFGGIRGYGWNTYVDEWRWNANARDQYNDLIYAIQRLDNADQYITPADSPSMYRGAMPVGWRVGMYPGTTDPGVFKKVLNPKGDLWLMQSRVGGPYTCRIGKHRKKPAFNFVGRAVISRTRKGHQPGDPYTVSLKTVMNVRRLGLNMHPVPVKIIKRLQRVGKASAGCQGAAKEAIREMLCMAADALMHRDQKLIPYTITDREDFPQ